MMNGTWQDIPQIMGMHILIQAQQHLAQAVPAPINQTGQAVEASVDYVQGLAQRLWAFIPNLLAAVLVLLVGWLIAAIAKAATRGILNRTNLDNKIAAGVMGRSDSGDLPQIENLVADLVFWIIILFTVVAVLSTLQLEAVSQPLSDFLRTVVGFLPRIVGAVIILGIAWLIATVVKLLTTRGLRAARLDERLNQPPEPGAPAPQNQLSLSETIGNALYWFIFLVFLIPILDTLGLQQALRPVQNLVDTVLRTLPNILGAILIAAAGWLLATVVRRLVTNLLISTGINRIGNQFGLRSTTGAQSLAGVIGTVVYILILIPIAIAALNTLGIQAISAPAIAMLQQILSALPLIFTAALILALAYFLGRFVSDLVTSVLTSIGFNNIFSILGLPSPYKRRQPTPTQPRDFTAPPTEERIVVEPTPTEQRTTVQPTPTAAATTRTPSEIIGIVVLVGIMLFATVAAINVLNIPALTLLVTGITVIFGQILAGLVVFAIGLFLSNLAYSIIASSGNRQAQIVGQVARVAIIVLVSAMALQQIGVASEIVNLAFGLLLGAIAVAIALSFGLGSRDIAREQVRELLDSFKQQREKPRV